jgi:serine/tyrosine/threonine adenylyltransferase
MNIDNRYTLLDPRLFHKQPPEPLNRPVAGHFNAALALQLDWPYTDEKDWVQILAGHVVPHGFDPLAMAYAGHQFGQWAGQLGDGRGLLLAQVFDQNNTLQDLHLKGAGLTPYSRMGDGRAVLRSVIREYLAGHALNALGIASSNALGFVSSSLPVQREKLERGACVLRVADCHVRLGHFEWINRFAADALPDFTAAMINTYYPECKDAPSPILAFAESVINKTAKTIADWQLIGFAHGVMNTDNLSITGSTLDFGPYGFMERFEPAWMNNHSDHAGRYTYQNQPSMAHWNLWVWLGQLLPLSAIDSMVSKESLSALLATFEPEFLHQYTLGVSKKMGLRADQTGVLALSSDFLRILERNRLDLTNSFRLLSDESDRGWRLLRLECISIEEMERFDAFAAHYQSLIRESGFTTLERQTMMNAANPIYVLRNHMAQTAIERAEAGDFSEVARLFDLLATPFTRQMERQTPADTAPMPDDHPPVSVSCSS